MAIPTQRLIIEIQGGCVSAIIADGIDLQHVTAIVVDYDTEGADSDELTDLGGTPCFFSPTDIRQADDEESRDIRRAYDMWALS
jgi:hypothetical protein